MGRTRGELVEWPAHPRHLAKVVVDISFQREYMYLSPRSLFRAVFKHSQISGPFAYANAWNSGYSDMTTRGGGRSKN